MKSETLSQVPPMSGSDVMTSPTRIPARAAAAVSATAALITNMPIRTSHSPPTSARPAPWAKLLLAALIAALAQVEES